MKISGINSFVNKMPELTGNKKINDNPQFGNMLTDFIGNVNESQKGSASMTKEFLQGGDIELHEVMVAGQKAKTNLQLLVEIRNKSIDMYKELTRMQ